MEQKGAAITFSTGKIYHLLEVTTKIRLVPIGTFFKFNFLQKKLKKISNFPNYGKKSHFLPFILKVYIFL